jgi:hypothetical protein
MLKFDKLHPFFEPQKKHRREKKRELGFLRSNGSLTDQENISNFSNRRMWLLGAPRGFVAELETTILPRQIAAGPRTGTAIERKRTDGKGIAAAEYSVGSRWGREEDKDGIGEIPDSIKRAADSSHILDSRGWQGHESGVLFDNADTRNPEP